MSLPGARLDIARFGFEAFRASPRQADLLILSGRVSIKMAPVVRRIYDQMLEPEWAIAMGACCVLDGRLQQLRDRAGRQVHAVDVHVPGCPPRPEALMHGILKLRDRDPGQRSGQGWRERYGAERHRGAARRPRTCRAPTPSTSSKPEDRTCLTRPAWS